jgi:hypothetical protein
MNDKKVKQLSAALFMIENINTLLNDLAEGIDDEELKKFLVHTTLLHIHLERKLESVK